MGVMSDYRDPGELLKVLKQELLNNSLQPISVDFYREALKAVARLGEDEKLLKEEVKKTLETIFLIRLKKEVDLLIKGVKLDEKSLPPEEYGVIEKIKETINGMEKVVFRGEDLEKSGRQVTSQAKGSSGEQRSKVEEFSFVYFRKSFSPTLDAPERGKSMKSALFKKGDFALIPKRLAREYKEQGTVEIIEELLEHAK
ncbi:hypothetical protein Tpen_0382 [Thermofilum pendens Hrk 5]|uniref:DNA replication complex GINS family protein n=1 Tax=Thermofilum pendens (strain DSM 2475 / Hrk 5) TaxID=368408 RepID=A1RX61_THEPD|nr:hypothetical protein Tpen_0382 [Thermofilum pendens Hrk 5]